MNKIAQDRIEDIKKNGYTLDFGNVFNLAFENYKKIALYGGLVFFVFAVLFSILGAVVLFSVFDSETILENLKPERFKPENLNLNTMLIFSAVSVFAFLLQVINNKLKIVTRVNIFFIFIFLQVK